jgi:hypothetical protein
MPTGSFQVMPQVGLRSLLEMFRASVLHMLKKAGKSDADFVRLLMQQRHVSGFNIHNDVKIERKDVQGREALAQYIVPDPFSLEKVRDITETGTVAYLGDE